MGNIENMKCPALASPNPPNARIAHTHARHARTHIRASLPWVWPWVWQAPARDVVKKAASKKNRYLFMLPGQLAPLQAAARTIVRASPYPNYTLQIPVSMPGPPGKIFSWPGHPWVISTGLQ